MPDMSTARRVRQAASPPSAPQRAGTNRADGTRTRWLPTWSVPAALRALRAVLVIPPLFALTYEGIGNLQIALFTAFGGFATLVVASFGGSRRDKIVAHFGLAVIGSIGLIIGTSVSGIKWLAVLVTIPVAFGIFFAGVDMDELERQRKASAAHHRSAMNGDREAGGDYDSTEAAARDAFHAQVISVADASDVQHGFWVVLGTLSVLRTNAAATGSTALRALGGTAVGFVVGALLLVGIGTSPAALWAALPIAIAVAAYAPGALPFAVGQAAFTIVIVVLFNLLAPVGWTVGLLRIEDVAIGCAVSLVIGALFWPRGAASVVGDDLADAFQRGAAYLTQAVDWALGTRHDPPDTGTAAVTAGIRLDEALRAFLTEQGAKHLSKQDLWTLVRATMRLRLTAYSLAGLQAPEHPRRHHDQRGIAHARLVLGQAAADLAAFYDRIALLVGRPVAHEVLMPVTVPAFTGLSENGGIRPPGGTNESDGIDTISGTSEPGERDAADGADAVRIITSNHHPRLLWVQEHLQHLSGHAGVITGPATHVADQRRLPWWR
jgi:Fusaric acid resistance protein-like